MKAKLQNKSLQAALAGVLGSLTLAFGFGAVALIPSANAASNAAQTSSGWTHLGGEPLFSGGLTKIAADKHISLRQALVYAVTSSRGQTALIYAGLDAAERHAVNTAVRTGKFQGCQLKYGMTFEKMSFGINGTAVDSNVTFLDPRYRNSPASAFCVNAKAEGAVVHLLIPFICVNVAVINRTVAPKPKTPKPAPKPKTPKPGTVNIWIRKQAFSAASEEQLINPTPTNVFRFRVQCGAKGKPRYIVYQSDPQYAGTCKTNAGRVLIWELSTLGPDKWQNLSPVYQTFKLNGKKKVLAVYKDKQVKQPVVVTTTTTTTTATTPPPPPPPTTTTVVTTTTTITTTPKHFTNLTCQGQEEVTGGGSSLLVCSVSNDNGAQISLNVKVLSNTGNLLVSGIQCSSQNGAPACQGNGTYEIRLGGVNDTTSPIYSELKVTATSNGVSSDPFDQTFKVDPSCSNFGC